MATIIKRPSEKWQATVRNDGQSRPKTFLKPAGAAKWASEIELRAKEGRSWRQSKRSFSRATAFGTLGSEWSF